MSQLFLFHSFNPAPKKVTRPKNQPKRIKQIIEKRLDELKPYDLFKFKGIEFCFIQKQGFICIVQDDLGVETYLQGQSLVETGYPELGELSIPFKKGGAK